MLPSNSSGNARQEMIDLGDRSARHDGEGTATDLFQAQEGVDEAGFNLNRVRGRCNIDQSPVEIEQKGRAIR